MLHMIGKLLLVIGIGLTAAYGAINPAQVDAQSSAASQLRQATARATEAQTAYCEARTAAELGSSEACPAEGGAFDMADTAESLSGDARVQFDAWQAANAERDAADATLAAIPAMPSGERLKALFDRAGVPFLIGLVLVVTGSLVSRSAVKAAAQGSGASKDGSGPVDFGAMLHGLHASVSSIADRLAQTHEPTPADFKAMIAEIEALQLEAFEPLVEARGQVQARYGMATFAAIFGPLSGGERFINRTWSALVDKHWPEATQSARSAAQELATAAAEVPGSGGA